MKVRKSKESKNILGPRCLIGSGEKIGVLEENQRVVVDPLFKKEGVFRGK